MNSQFKRFIRNLIVFSWPILVLAIAYFVLDPFYVLKVYDAYPDNYLKSYNRNRVSTQVFLNNNKKVNYRSFVFGSSKSSSFYTSDWKKYINDPTPYHFDASNEIISGIAGKLKYIDQQGNKLENLLFIIDNETFSQATDTANSIIHKQDYRWSGENRFNYYATFFKAFFHNFYFWKYFDAKISGKFKPYMYGVIESKHIIYTPINNDFIFQDYIDRIKKDSLGYYSADYFYERSEEEVETPHQIKAYHLVFLNEIKNLIAKNHSNVKVVIAPSYDQQKLNSQDKTIIEHYFGKNNVYDYSGKNIYTNNLSNYYEIFHFKPVVGRAILKEIYNN